MPHQTEKDFLIRADADTGASTVARDTPPTSPDASQSVLIDAIAARVLSTYRSAFEELAK